MARIGFTERLAQHRRAVIALAHQSARRAIKRQFQAQGVRLSDVTARDLTIWAEAWFDTHRQELIAEAENAIATWPGFERWRKPSHNPETATDLTR